MPALAYVGCVELSAQDADTVYITATRYKLADYQPYLFRSSDSGRSWQSINGDFPADEITRVLRADKEQRGLLFVGTETGVFMSLDDGQSWARMKGGLPVAPVYDMQLKGADSSWPPTAVPSGCSTTSRRCARWPMAAPGHAAVSRRALGAGADAFWRLHRRPRGGHLGALLRHRRRIDTSERADGTKRRQHLDVGENPPNGAIVYYWLEPDAGPVTLTFRDAAGGTIATFRGDDTALPRPSGPARGPASTAMSGICAIRPDADRRLAGGAGRTSRWSAIPIRSRARSASPATTVRSSRSATPPWRRASPS